jgi:dihydrolipoamide dehydrogenase
VAVPPGWTVDGQKIVTYLEAIQQEKLPKSAIVIGAGAIGVEFATVWNAYGVEVSVVEMLPRLVPLEDEEVSTELTRAFKKRKINLYTGQRVQSIAATDTGVEVKVSGEKGEQTLVAEQALVAIGFRPNGRGLGLEELGVKLTERGAVEIDERMATNVPGIWAIGDVTAKLMLAHVGSAQGIVCAEHIAGAETITLNYEMMPRATYCQPQVASFGITEAQAKERGLEVKVGRFPFSANGKASGLGESTGWVKIVTEAKYGEILGAHMIGPEVTELLPELTLAQMMELTPEQIARNVHAHPTLSEVLMEAAHAAEGQPIHI